MPVKSKAQARFMRAVASGKVKKPGLTKAKALEFVSGQPTKKLPEKVSPKIKKIRRMKKLSKVFGI